MARSTSSPVAGLRYPDTTRYRGVRLPSTFSCRCARPSGRKNLLVFAGLLFGRRLFDAAGGRDAVAAFVVFCALSGVVYLVNDIADRESDRRHPLKARRPIASGALPVPIAAAIARRRSAARRTRGGVRASDRRSRPSRRLSHAADRSTPVRSSTS